MPGSGDIASAERQLWRRDPSLREERRARFAVCLCTIQYGDCSVERNDACIQERDVSFQTDQLPVRVPHSITSIRPVAVCRRT
jgi:hypothetical protein